MWLEKPEDIMRHVTIAATQFACSWDLPANADKAEALVRQAIDWLRLRAAAPVLT